MLYFSLTAASAFLLLLWHLNPAAHGNSLFILYIKQRPVFHKEIKEIDGLSYAYWRMFFKDNKHCYSADVTLYLNMKSYIVNPALQLASSSVT